MTLADIIDDVDSRQHTLTVLNREEYDPVVNLLEKMFDSEHVDVREGGTEPAAPGNVLMLQDEEGLAVATSTLDEVRDQLLLVNSDLYITGTRPLAEVETSDVVANMDDTTFTVSGKSKFLLIHISRHVERMALETGGGVLHSGFQELSRIHDERGTDAAYRQLVDTDVDVHVYGIPDWDAPPESMYVHAATDGEIPEAWFVVHDGDGRDERKAALVCVETGPNEYEGFWTFQPAIVDEVLDYLKETYVEN
ncbi:MULTISPECIES: DICT sensory domain-containing protein [Salinibaculum]|uniref:DICT sensory domain-containing protein n=1 Tax=Salinibaculum TaxID=2732368 RepID=UPI0030CD2FE6